MTAVMEIDISNGRDRISQNRDRAVKCTVNINVIATTKRKVWNTNRRIRKYNSGRVQIESTGQIKPGQTREITGHTNNRRSGRPTESQQHDTQCVRTSTAPKNPKRAVRICHIRINDCSVECTPGSDPDITGRSNHMKTNTQKTHNLKKMFHRKIPASRSRVADDGRRRHKRTSLPTKL